MDPEVSKILGELYRPRYEENFKHHPNKDEIVNRLVKGGDSIEQIELWFKEASHYTWKHIMDRPMPKPNADGTVTFRYHKGSN